ncbi:MAG: D-lyxose/D-mannose family sugar isomerase [Phycisphaeraceae bacterium]|nr:D-lyxose/D-mannose family sugar isomerase [Phycisphaeraceae bacterium]
MKRSEINHEIRDAQAFLDKHGFALPPFASWTPDHWKTVGSEADEIRSRALGWDVTDFGSGRFGEIGLTVFTIRNGRLDDDGNRKIYAEKILIVREDQVTPFHFHFSKTEDIINRGGGNLVVVLCNSDEKEELADTPVTVSCDGVTRTVPAGGKVVLGTGESITLVPGVYHEFKGEAGSGTVLVGEVSSVNDDAVDNRFLNELPRFPEIEEDETPLRLLCTEYPRVG